MERVSPISAALLQLESRAGQMHVGFLARVDAGAGGASLDVGALRERVAQRIERMPRLRHVVTPAGERDGRLVWREQEGFELARHLAVCDAPVGGEEELRTVVDAFLARELERSQPLWRVLIVPSTRAGGAAIVAAAHRALCADAGACSADEDLLRELVFDRAPPRRGGVGGTGTVGASAHDDALALDEFRAARRLGALGGGGRGGRGGLAGGGGGGRGGGLGGGLGSAGRVGATLRRAAYARTEGLLAPAPPSYLNAAVAAGPAPRTLVTARLELGRLRRIAERGGVELHDVVLAVAAGALRRVALAAGQEPADLRALVPVAPGPQALLGEEPCAVVELPVSQRNPALRLQAIHAAMASARGPRRERLAASAAGAAPAGDAPQRPPTLLAGPPEELPTRLAIGARLANLTIPSAEGPQQTLHVGGAQVRALFPVAPHHDEHALTLSTLSYGRHLHVAAAVDAAAIGGVGRLPVMLADAVEELLLATGAR